MIEWNPLALILALFCAHALCDYPLQGDFLARGKNHKSPLPGVPWYQCLLAHCLIHAGAVALLTWNPWFGIAEFVVHWFTDYSKCDGWFGGAPLYVPDAKTRESSALLTAFRLHAERETERINRRAFNIDQAIPYGSKLFYVLILWILYAR